MYHRFVHFKRVSPMGWFFIACLATGFACSAASAWMKVIYPELISSLLIDLSIWILSIECFLLLYRHISRFYLKRSVPAALNGQKGTSWVCVAVCTIVLGTWKSGEFALNMQKHANFANIASALGLDMEQRLFCESKASGWLTSYCQQQRYQILMLKMKPFLQQSQNSPERQLIAETIVECASDATLWSEYVKARRALKVLNAEGYPEGARASYAYQLYLTSQFEADESENELIDLPATQASRMKVCNASGRLAIWGIAAETLLRSQEGRIFYLGQDMNWRCAVEISDLSNK